MKKLSCVESERCILCTVELYVRNTEQSNTGLNSVKAVEVVAR